MEMKEIKHHIDERTYVVVTKDGWEVYKEAYCSSDIMYITTISNRSITRSITLQSILKDQEA